MRFFILIAVLILPIGINAETKLFLAFTVNNTAELKQLDEALQVGQDLREAINSLSKNGQSSEDLKELQSKLQTYEINMQKVYGLYPGLNYKMVPTSGYIFNLIPENKRDFFLQKGYKIPVDSPIVVIKDKEGNDLKCFKVKIKLLQKRESVLQFNQALNTVTSLKQQIKSIENQLKEKPELKSKKEIIEGLKNLNSALATIEEKMDERFAVKKDGAYIFEPKTGAVYLALNKDELEKLSNFNKARIK